MPHNLLALQIFISYARADIERRRAFEAQLHKLKSDYPYLGWSTDEHLVPGLEWHPTLKDQIQGSDLVALLITPAYLDSRYCMTTELPLAMAKHRRKPGSVVPILVEATAGWHNQPFGKLHVLPTPTKPITDPHWGTPRRYWKQVERDLRRTLDDRASRWSDRRAAVSEIDRRSLLRTGVILVAGALLLGENPTLRVPDPPAFPRVVSVVQVVRSRESRRHRELPVSSWSIEGDDLVVSASDGSQETIQLLVEQELTDGTRRLEPFLASRRGDVRFGTRLTWAQEFEPIGASHSIAVVLPTADDWHHLAWKTLSAGQTVFINSAKEPWLTVSSFDDRGSATTAKEILPKLLATKPVAVVGSYHSSVTRVLIQECTDDSTDEAWNRSKCGPILTLSSATSLRQDPPDIGARFFYVTTGNKERAKSLVRMIEHDCRGDIVPNTRPQEVWIVYEDDRQHGSDVSYAIDQKAQVLFALQGSSLSEMPVRAVSFRDEPGKGLKVVADAAWSSSPVQSSVNDAKTFDELVAALNQESDVAKIVVFIALDRDIVDFGKALRQVPELGTPSARLRVYVPGPSEVFEEDWVESFGDGYRRFLLGMRVVTPYENRQSENSIDFNEQWYAESGDRRFPTRGARVYDALRLTQAAIKKVDEELRAYAFVDRGWFRTLVGDVIADMQYPGVSALLMFNSQDELNLTPKLTEMLPCGLQTLGSRCERISEQLPEMDPAPTDPALKQSRPRP